MPYALIVGGCVFSQQAFAQAVADHSVAMRADDASVFISEKSILDFVYRHHPEIALAQAQVEIAKANSLAATLYPNPSINFARETVNRDQGPDGGENVVALSVPIDFSSTRKTQGLLAQEKLHLAQYQLAKRQREIANRLLIHFYRLLALQKRLVVERKLSQGLKDAAQILRRRFNEGKASGYDQYRLALEAELAASRMRETHSELARQKTNLAALLEVPNAPTKSANLALSGSLELSPATVTLVESTHSDSGDAKSKILKKVALAQSAASEAEESSTWSWIPRLDLRGGPRQVQAGQKNYGYVAGATVELPIFSRGQGVRALGEARKQQAAARWRQESRQLRVDLQTLQAKLRYLVAEIQEFHDATARDGERIERAVESGYQAGERSIMELIDARRARSTAELRLIELGLAAKQTEILLRAARGEFDQ